MTEAHDSSPLEIELKLAFPPDARARIEDHPAFHSPGVGGARSGHQISTYFDTADFALARDGLSLRVRAKDGRRTQTLKSDAGGSGAAAHRGEWEWSVMADRPDTALLAGTPAAVHAGKALEPVVVTDIYRTVRLLTLDRGTVVEAAVDEGTISGGDDECPVHELELELKEGPPGPLYSLALTLHADLPLRMEAEAKATRGYRLRTHQPPASHKTSSLKLDRDIGAADGFRQILAAGLGALIANQPAAAAGDPEGVHQMRIAVRRLRTAFLLFKPHLEPHVTARFEDELRRLGQVLGEARDRDVFCLETIPAALGDTRSDLRTLLEPAADADRQATRRRLNEEFARPNLTGLVLAIAAWAEDDDLVLDKAATQSRLADLAPALLDHLAQKVAKRGRHIGRLSGPELHAARKALKKLRYAADDLAGLYSKKAVKAFRSHCKAIQGELGTINDAAMAVTLAESLAGDGQVDRVPAVAAVVRWSEKHRQKALRRLPKCWEKFRQAKAFWH